MKSGELRHRITFQMRSVAQDSLGGQSNAWADLLTVWAKLEPLSGRELFAARSVQSEVTHQITIRWQSEFADPKTVAAMRVIYNGRHFNLGPPINTDERNIELVIPATEGLNDG